MKSDNLIKKFAIFGVLALCICTRIAFITQKESLHGDETVSLILAYNATGWGNRTYAEGQTYTSEELKSNLFVDDKGGMQGWIDDIVALWDDNRDPSHASLYYMLLRTSLIGQDECCYAPVIRRGCGLNIFLFIVSFLCMAALLRKLLPDKPFSQAGILLLAYLNPLSVSTSLFVREYQLAECALTAFSLFAIHLAERINKGCNILTTNTVAIGSILSAILLSAGYFNAIFAIMVCVCLIVKAWNKSHRQKTVLYFAITISLSILLCIAIYKGFFNFTEDVRTAEVVDKAKGGDFLTNVIHSAKAGIKMILFNVWGPILSIWVAILLATAIIKKKKINRMPYLWLFLTAFVWFVIVMLLSTWKMTRYVAPCIPLLAVMPAFYILQMSRSEKWKYMPVLPLIALQAWTLAGNRIEHLEKNNCGSFPADSRHLVLYTKVDQDRDMLTLIAPCMSGDQDCIIVSNTEAIESNKFSTDSVTYVFADNNIEKLQKMEGYQETTQFNDWMWIYKIKNK